LIIVTRKILKSELPPRSNVLNASSTPVAIDNKEREAVFITEQNPIEIDGKGYAGFNPRGGEMERRGYGRWMRF
jgi:hypothetical protein